jgi:hypothetical protein
MTRVEIEDTIKAILASAMADVPVISNPNGGTEDQALAKVKTAGLVVVTYAGSKPGPVDEKGWGRMVDRRWAVTCLAKEYRSVAAVGASALGLVEAAVTALDGADITFGLSVESDRLVLLDPDRFPGLIAYELMVRVADRTEKE